MKNIKARNLAPMRLDKFLMQEYPALGLGRLNKALRENKIKLNGKKQPLSTRVLNGDTITLYILDDQLDAGQQTGPRCPAEVLYENDQMLVVNKPAGLIVDGSVDEDTLLGRVQMHLDQTGGRCRPRLCHRLDTGTSGLVLVAKTDEAEHYLTDLIRSRSLQKYYLCVTFGRPRPAADTLQGWLVKDADHGIVKVVDKRSDDAKEILTEYETLAVSGRLALCKVHLLTGRTHQIRAHMASIGCPVLGDSKYGNNAANRELKLKYQALCAWQLVFPASLDNAAFSDLAGKTFTVPKPWYCQQVLDGTLK